MTAIRKHRLVDCNPTWGREGGDGVTRGVERYVMFDCPEGHDGCRKSIPFTPARYGQAVPSPQLNGAIWDRTGDTFETMTLSPSIRSIPVYTSREAAEAAGVDDAQLDDQALYCALHIFIRNGQIEFCDDSK